MDLDLSGIKELNEGFMADACIIEHPASGGTFNHDTGQYDDPDMGEVYAGKCQIWSARNMAGRQERGGQPTTDETYYFEIPLEADLPEPEDLITVTAVSGHGDLALEGKQFLVTTTEMFTHTVSKIIQCTRIVRNPG